MSHSKHSTPTSTLTRRTMLAGSSAAVAATGLAIGLPGTASAALASKAVQTSATAKSSGANALCAAHHAELSSHLKTILNGAYVDEVAKNKLIKTSHCPHCKVAIAPDMMDRAAFSAMA